MSKTIEGLITKAIRDWNKKQTFEPVEKAALAIKQHLIEKVEEKKIIEFNNIDVPLIQSGNYNYNQALQDVIKIIEES